MARFMKLFICGWLLSGFFACATLENEGKKEGVEMDDIEGAIRQDYLKTRDPLLNYVPIERLAVARRYMENMQSNTGIGMRTAALGWQERGPNNIGGRTRSMIIDRRDATGNTVLAGSVSGGIFRTTNFTSGTPTWAPVNDFLNNLAITCMWQDNVNADIMYAGTGEGWFNVDAVRGAGIFKSTDGGLNWTQMPSTTGFEYVQDFIIDNSGNLYASLRNLQTNNRGVMRSSDLGLTWIQVLGAPLPGFNTGRAADLELASNGDVYASLGLVGESFANRSVVMKSSFATNGANTGALNTWVNITPVTPTVTQRTEIVLAPSDPQRVYLLMQDSATQQVLNIFRSTNGGTNWTTLTAPPALNNGAASQTWYNLIGAVDPTNADILIVGGLGLARSTDAGNTWTTITGGIHVDQHALYYIGATRLVVGNDGGVYYTTNANTNSPTFANKNNGYNVTQYYGCDFHPTNTNYFLAGAQDNGTQKFTTAGMNSPGTVSGGDGGFPHIDQTNGVIQITAATGNNYFLSINSGNSFSQMALSNDRGQFINPTDFDDLNKIMYCGDDAGAYFFIRNFLTSPVGTVVNVTAMGGREVTAVKMDLGAANTVWLGTSYNDALPQILKLSSANSSAPVVVTNATLGTIVNASVSSIDIDPANTNHIVATLSNYGVTSIWESTNGGTSFSSIEGNLPDMPVHWITFAPPTAQLNGPGGGDGGLIIGTELGVWTTSAIVGAATQWIPNNSGLANVRTDMLKYRATDNTLVAATHGRGLYTTALPNVVTGIPPTVITKDFIKYISVNANQLLVATGSLQTKTMSVRILNMKGQAVYESSKPYSNQLFDIARLASGSYIIRITGNNRENFTGRFVK